MLGHGGFGEVYKGILPNGTEVAVKRLSKKSGQGAQERKKILMYELVPNKSLDYILFDPEKQGQLDWPTRYKIITGTARGILYLHQDSRLTIIHRDLKASNILLDADMTPKIADFGMARIIELDQTLDNTSRIAGTYGYMSPEYVMHGLYSTKSDVYSFGVLVLEIINGKPNSSFHQTDISASNLVTYAWRLWTNGSPFELVDLHLVESCDSSEVTRCIHIALLCVQENPKDRPTLSTIILMLTSNTITLPVPHKPGFFFGSTRDQNAALCCSKTNITMNMLLLFFWFVFTCSGLVSALPCMNTSFFTPFSTYDTNRRLVLTSLASNVTTHRGFYKASIGQPPNIVYAAGMCIPGTEPEICSACIMSGSYALIENCRTQKEASFWASNRTLCMIRYSHTYFIGSLDLEPSFDVFNPMDLKINPTEFSKTWKGLTVRMIQAISSNNDTTWSGGKYYAADVAALPDSQTLYGLMQCTPDLSKADCNICLQECANNYQKFSLGSKEGL
ncbi:hypothetical protein AALP_AAs67984U000400 [Arabis alpina]|uniref:Protein kinase domain-containing protein n=1 Tax=Arabis alpina TaxID=50452 RepID=A0A087FYK0_ARAAL|nr:hypothetical protein AALP_AAs67984U000400 [Arabis alpina]